MISGLDGNGIVVEWTKVKTLGSGSYGQVHLAKLPNLVSGDHLLAAVKSCAYPRSDSIQKELHILRQFQDSDKIVKCFGDVVSLKNGVTVYNLFLEYDSSGTLRDLIRRYGGNTSEPAVKCYIKMLFEGLRCIHAKGYVHCDLKPKNILVFP
ncbi:hypothetical protein V6N13_006004 [Hibiscus sabdariffa]